MVHWLITSLKGASFMTEISKLQLIFHLIYRNPSCTLTIAAHIIPSQHIKGRWTFSFLIFFILFAKIQVALLLSSLNSSSVMHLLSALISHDTECLQHPEIVFILNSDEHVYHIPWVFNFD